MCSFLKLNGCTKVLYSCTFGKVRDAIIKLFGCLQFSLCCQAHRVHIGIEEKQGGVYLPAGAGAYTTTLYVMVDRVKGGGCLPPHPHHAGWADFTSRWNVRQKVVIAALCVLCGQAGQHILPWISFHSTAEKSQTRARICKRGAQESIPRN
jgi:hypothetical protein